MCNVSIQFESSSGKTIPGKNPRNVCRVTNYGLLSTVGGEKGKERNQSEGAVKEGFALGVAIIRIVNTLLVIWILPFGLLIHVS